MKQKSKIFQKFKEMKAMVENQKGKKVKALRYDNGGEYTSIAFEKCNNLDKNFTYIFIYYVCIYISVFICEYEIYVKYKKKYRCMYNNT